MTTIQSAPAASVHTAAAAVEGVLGGIDAGLARCADTICRKVLRISPAPKRARQVNDRRPEANLDIEVQRAYRHDTQWAVPLMWWEMALGGVGGATFAVSALTGNTAGMATGWTLGSGAKGVLLLFDLGRPERVPRVFAKPGTSWIARGSWAFAVFAGCGAAAVGLRLLGRPQLAALPSAVASAAAGVLISYDGFFLNQSPAVSGWESPYLPALFAANATLAGSAVAGATSLRTGRWTAAVSLGAAAASAGLAKVHLDHLADGDAAAVLTHDELTQGVEQPDFVLGAGVVGTVVPALLAVVGATQRLRTAWCLAAGLSSLGVLLGRKAILKSGIHSPVI